MTRKQASKRQLCGTASCTNVSEETKQKHRISFRWKSGNGEILGFAASAFILVLIAITLMGVMNYSIESQQLTTACYTAGRAAAVSQSASLAKSRALAVLKIVYNEIDDDSLKIEYEDNTWEIGKMMTISVNHHIDSIFPFPEMTIQRSLVMMIENQRTD